MCKPKSCKSSHVRFFVFFKSIGSRVGAREGLSP